MAAAILGSSMDHDVPALIAASIAAFLVGLGKGGLAMAGALAVPVMALTMSPVRAAAILLPVYVFSDLIAVWLYRRDYSARNLKILIPAACLGIALGWATASRVPDRGVEVVIGVIGLAFCYNSWRMRHSRPVEHPADVPRGLLWGSVLGFASFVSHAGSPLFQIYVLPQRLPKLVYAGTSALCFAAVNLIKLGPYWALGQFSTPNLVASAYLLLPALAGTQVGRRLVNVLPERAYFTIVQIALLAVSVELLAKGLGA
jgi:uncharacterized membrane protein YfcA